MCGENWSKKNKSLSRSLMKVNKQTGTKCGFRERDFCFRDQWDLKMVTWEFPGGPVVKTLCFHF